MLQSVGIFVSVHKNTAWGNYVSTLPAPRINPIIGIIISMYIIGIIGILLIGCIDHLFYHVLSYQSFLLAIIGTSLGAVPMGALGYLIGVSIDQISARNVLMLIGSIFLFMTFLPQSFQSILAYVALPNIWITVSESLVFARQINIYGIVAMLGYFAIFISLIFLIDTPRKQYWD